MDPNLELDYIIQIILNLLTMALPILLIIQVLHRKHRTLEINLFLGMCIIDIILCFSTACLCLYMVFFWSLDSLFGSFSFHVFLILFETGKLALVVFWLLFVEYTLHQSRDIIRRRYGPAMIPFYVGVSITIAASVLPLFPQVPFLIIGIVYMLDRWSLLIWLFYILATYYVRYREGKRVRIPQYIRLTPTVIFIALGYFLYFFTGYRTVALGYAIGLMFADYYMFRRLGFLDQKTGFFNEKYLKELNKETEKRNINEAMVIRFKAPENDEKLATILGKWKPEHSKIVVKSNREYLVLSEPQKEYIAERFVSLVREQCEAEGINVESSHEMIHR